MILLETGSTDPFYNLAFEEFVLLNRTCGDILILWQNDRTVVIGRNQCTEAEIDPEYIRSNSISVVRRSTGGGAVYHDLGNLNYSFITDCTQTADEPVNRFTNTVVEALRGLGLNACASGRNDILVDGCKVSGTAQRIVNGRILYHGTLLFSADLSAAAEALKPHPEKFAGKGIASVRSRITNIRDHLASPMTMQEFHEHIRKAFSKENSMEASLDPDELGSVMQLKKEKYDSWEWNYGRSPEMEFHKKRRWEGGTLEISYSQKRGKITEIEFYGDFLSMCPLTDLKDALIGCCCKTEDIKAVLDRFDLTVYFGTISATEILLTMFENTAGS